MLVVVRIGHMLTAFGCPLMEMAGSLCRHAVAYFGVADRRHVCNANGPSAELRRQRP